MSRSPMAPYGSATFHLLLFWVVFAVASKPAASVACKRWDYASCYGATFRVLDWHVGAAQDQWLDWKAFKEGFLGNTQQDFKGKPFISTEVKEVPCRAHGCCNLQVYFRPNTTDYGVFEQVFPWHYFNFLYDKLLEPEYILDAGANVGFSSMLFSLLYPNAKIIAIEPDKENFQALKLNTMKFPNVYAVNAGVWDKNVYITLKKKEGEWGYMFKEMEDQHQGNDKKQGTLGLTIPYLMKKFNFPRLDYAKIDVEGAEGIVFGAKADLGWLNDTSFVSLELHDHFAQHYGLDNVSKVVAESMSSRKFHEEHDNEHVFYTRIVRHKRNKNRGLKSAGC